MPTDTAPLRRLSDLAPAERHKTEAAILRVLNEPQNMGWAKWELPELIAAAAPLSRRRAVSASA
jgi:hypothetical protein